MVNSKVSELAVTLPFTITPYGIVGTTEDQSKIWEDRVRTAVGTTLGERVMRPSFGSNVAAAVFQTEDGATETIESTVAGVFAEFLNILSLSSVEVAFDSNGDTANVVISYILPNEETQVTLVGPYALTTDAQVQGRLTLQGSNQPNEVNYGR
jgi:phage baseplate assembly protein W